MPHRERLELMARLNDDLAREYAAVIQNRNYASLVAGPHRPALRRLLTAQVAQELAHASLLSDTIAALGGVPTVRVAPVSLAAHETQPTVMLRRLLEAKAEAVERFTTRRALAERAGEHGLAVELDDVIADETRHRDELVQLLRGWQPARGDGSSSAEDERERPTSLVVRCGVAVHAARFAAGPYAAVQGPGDGGGSGDGVLRS
jgi:bacterioferritin